MGAGAVVLSGQFNKQSKSGNRVGIKNYYGLYLYLTLFLPFLK
jgi:hypothetical protein